jgi:hypothetical protein
MGERRWVPFDPFSQTFPSHKSKTNAEVLAEMPTDELVLEVMKRFEIGEYLTSPELFRFLQRVQVVMSRGGE